MYWLLSEQTPVQIKTVRVSIKDTRTIFKTFVVVSLLLILNKYLLTRKVSAGITLFAFVFDREEAIYFVSKDRKKLPKNHRET